MGRSRRATATTAAIGLGILIAASGIAFAGLTKRSRATMVGDGATGSVAAKCPKGSQVVSGGFEGGPDYHFNTGLNFGLASRRTSKRGWKVAGWNLNDLGAEKLTVHAYCTQNSPGLESRSARRTLRSDRQGSVTAACPRGTEAVSGGFAASFDAFGNGPELFVFTSRRIGHRRWKAAADNEGGTRGTLKAFAYCNKHEPGLTQRSQSVVVPTQTQPGRVAAECPKGREAFSGGFTNPEYGSGLDASAIVPFESFRATPRQWVVGARNFTDSGTLVAYAYCG